MKKVVSLAVAAAVLGLALGAGAAQLNTKSGTMELGGNFSFTPTVTMPDQGSNQTNYTLSISPSAGYFLIDNLEIMGGFNATMFFGDNTDSLPKLVGFALGARYLLSLGSMAPYVGLMVGMDFTIPDQGSTQKAFDIIAPIGLLFALNEWVAIDAGLRFNFQLALDDPKVNRLVIPIGYFGLQAFF